jgi:glycosidase
MQVSYQRVIPVLEANFHQQAAADPHAWEAFLRRLKDHFPTLFDRLYELYHTEFDFHYHLQDLLDRMARSWLERPPALRSLDEAREADPAWFQSNQMLGAVCYVDQFAGNLEGVRQKIPYFQELGLTYLHLMPLFQVPPGENDGGYAVSSYREVHAPLGTMVHLRQLADDLQTAGISLVLDFVLNHTASDHPWARQAQAGNEEYQEYYNIFPNRTFPDAYEKHLREIFPDEHPGAFSPISGGRWVWTTFHSYQWDLNYSNPAVFNQMASEMLFLANIGVDVLRFDALAFIWKEMGTVCENLPKAHTLIQAFNAAMRIAAPGVLFKSEAIVHPDDVVKYVCPEECQISYNPLLMALLWNSVATREVRMLRQALKTRFQLPEGCTWVNYIRSHDDIGWTFSDEDAARLDINGSSHRRFLNEFYTGRFPGSFARGLPFQENPRTGDCRISGTCASLAGLEKAILEETAVEVDLAIRRILLIHGVILTVGGIPLIYLGDEIATLNDYSYRRRMEKTHDSRWVHRPAADWDRFACRSDPTTPEGRVYQGLKRLIDLRKQHAVFTAGPLEVVDTGTDQVLGYGRGIGKDRLLILANFSEQVQSIPLNQLRLCGLYGPYTDLVTHQDHPLASLALEPYAFLCLR